MRSIRLVALRKTWSSACLCFFSEISRGTVFRLIIQIPLRGTQWNLSDPSGPRATWIVLHVWPRYEKPGGWIQNLLFVCHHENESWMYFLLVLKMLGKRNHFKHPGWGPAVAAVWRVLERGQTGTRELPKFQEQEGDRPWPADDRPRQCDPSLDQSQLQLCQGSSLQVCTGKEGKLTVVLPFVLHSLWIVYFMHYCILSWIYWQF